MSEESALLTELIKAKENIKQKFNALKKDQLDADTLVSDTFKPIINPLKSISDGYSNKIRSQPQISSSSTLYNTNKHDDDDDDDDVEGKHSVLNTGEKYFHLVDNWFKSTNKDSIYGPKILNNGAITLGNKEIYFDEKEFKMYIDDINYQLTPGLVQLLFSRRPEMYTDHDLRIYKSILIQTSAHLSNDGKKIKKGGIKYKDIISKLFTEGEGLSMSLQNHNVTYWDDPNELVDRLRLLIASQAAGNTGVANEILSIFEELKEHGLIENIPNE